MKTRDNGRGMLQGLDKVQTTAQQKIADRNATPEMRNAAREELIPLQKRQVPEMPRIVKNLDKIADAPQIAMN